MESQEVDVARAVGVPPVAKHQGEQQDHDHDEHAHGVDWRDLARIGLVALAAVAVWFRLWEPLPHFSIIGIVATLVGGYPIFKEALESLFERRMAMELSPTGCPATTQSRAMRPSRGHVHRGSPASESRFESSGRSRGRIR
jgi:hypothetical protein